MIKFDFNYNSRNRDSIEYMFENIFNKINFEKNNNLVLNTTLLINRIIIKSK